MNDEQVEVLLGSVEGGADVLVGGRAELLLSADSFATSPRIN